ncbi:ATP-binding protein [Hyphomonas johnsonii]|uniref:Endonuclease GajA/Old nuclease/RecF-like AAA domain-containing protein n=1 Tax=Hyphomonas johnsonii MHS-2 TaxID=1280950 RepID=A0A059FQ36_9PROT|nr:ATP-binding protein [Hyphomonas johnsonii]KCZ92737.1 hypothetical protein HJO_07277 [Hyphomonas johnsonii MHS-2]
MKIKALILENFRGYQAKTIIPFSQFTALIGRNDAGKSTILEALDIFFDNSKPDQGDACINGDARGVRIGIIFDHLPTEITLDRGARSTFQAEHLLNSDGDLEIHKVFNLGVQRPSGAKIFAIAVHPTRPDLADLLQKSNTQLKAVIRERGLEANCNLNENPSMRQAIYRAVGDLGLSRQEVPLNDENGKAIWTAIQSVLPLFVLFRSDRASSDQDPEVQNPMKVAVQKALSEIEEDLAAITAEVRTRVEETAARTLAQMQLTYPELAKTLTPQFRTPTWQNIFKVDLESDDGVPLNKRGSGVRRLVLMSFFQAEAKKKKEEAAADDLDGQRPVVYAIEEPETSQHPENQELIVEALKEIADAGDQVVITTHVPALAGLVPVDGLRYVDSDPATGLPRVRQGTPEIYEEIASALGVLPDPIKSNSIKVAVLVEGKTDVDALVSFSHVLSASGDIPALDQSKIFWAMGGGQTLKDWVERNYLGSLNVPQVVIFDSDRTSGELPAHEEKQRRLREINAWANRTAFMTRKREIENYIDLQELNNLAEGKLVYPAGIDVDHSDLTEVIAAALRDAIDNRDLRFRPTSHREEPIRVTRRNIKTIITAYVIRNMSADGIKTRCAYEHEGEVRYEVLEWLSAIQNYCAA